MTAQTEAHLVIHARWVIPIRPNPRTVLENHSVVVSNGKVDAVLPTASARELYCGAEELERQNHVVIPGLVNAHTHTGMSLLRGCADDIGLHEWLTGRVWPIEAAFLTQEGFCYDGALLSAADMIRGGTTTFNDMYWDVDAAARATVRVGMRAMLGMVVIAFPSSFGSTTEEYLARGEEARDKFRNQSRLSFSYAPHAPYTVRDDAWVEIARRAQRSNAVLHTHIHETSDEVEDSKALRRESSACHLSDNAVSPITNLDNLGVLSANVIAAHVVHATPDEERLLAKRNVAVAHCPTSNAKLAAGRCNIVALRAAGATVALGTDSACSNNSLDMFAEMKAAALGAKSLLGDAAVISAADALEMATMGGARALRLDEKIGSLEEGKCADMCVVELGTHAGNTPVYSVTSALVYAATRMDVCEVFVDGECLLREKKLTKIDEHDICFNAQIWANKIRKKFPAGDVLRPKE